MILLLIGVAIAYTFSASAFSTLFPVFGKEMLDLGPIEVGYFWSVYGVGLLVMSLGLFSLSGWPLYRRIQMMIVPNLFSGFAIRGLVLASNRLPAALRDRHRSWRVDSDCLGHPAGDRTAGNAGTCPGHLHSWRDGSSHRRDDVVWLDDARDWGTPKCRRNRNWILFDRHRLGLCHPLDENKLDGTIIAAEEPEAIKLATQLSTH